MPYKLDYCCLKIRAEKNEKNVTNQLIYIVIYLIKIYKPKSDIKYSFLI